MTENILKKIIEIPVNKIISGYKGYLDIDVTDAFEGIEYILLFQDNITGNRFFLPENIAGSGEFYHSLQKFEWYYQKEKWEFSVARKYVKSGKLLEVGCGMGFFLDSLEKLESFELLGTEYNEEAVAFCKAKGLNVDKYDWSAFKSSDLDYIVSFQVLEHLPNYRLFFQESFRSLKKGGKFIVGVPNSSSFVFYPFTENYFNDGTLLLNLPPHHMSWWNKKALIKAGNLVGFKFVSCEFEKPRPFRFRLMSKNISSVIGVPALENFINKYLMKALKYFLKGETMVIVFEK